jgi:hypothetical protein
VNFYSAGGVRQGYIGFSTTTATTDAGTLPYVAGTHAFTGAATFSSSVTAGHYRATSSIVGNATGAYLSYQGSSGSLIGAYGADASTTGFLRFWLSNSTGSTGTELMRLTNVGLGINNLSPSYTLDVTGQARVSDALGVGISAFNTSAIIQADSTTKGFLPPRMTAAQRAAISTPAEGLIVVQTDGVSGLYIYIGSTWRSLTMV